MRTISLILAAVFVFTVAPAFAAGPGGKTPIHTPPAVTLLFSVPYSFSNVHKELQYAVVRCVAMVGPKSPPIGSGETIVPLNGQSASGTWLKPRTLAPAVRVSSNCSAERARSSSRRTRRSSGSRVRIARHERERLGDGRRRQVREVGSNQRDRRRTA